LGHSASELARLSHQARLFEPFTRQLFEEAGIRPGMHILDIGSGAGDVSFLAAQLTGPDGEVVGIDHAKDAVDHATERAKAMNVGNVHFLLGDPTTERFDQEFDAIVGRFVLMYYPDPVDAMRKMVRHLRPGGLIVFQELDLENTRTVPSTPTFQEAMHWIRQAFTLTGVKINMGLELLPLFLAAGLPCPSLRIDAAIGGRADFGGFDLMSETLESLLPVIRELGIATEADVGISVGISDKIRNEVVRNNGIMISPVLVGAWSTKSNV